MARSSRILKLFTLAALLAAPTVHAQLSNLPNLSTVTNARPTSATSAATSQSTSEANSAASTFLPTLSGTSASFPGLTGLPTIAGASIPSLVIPNTADAPFMKKSKLPEGTVFIIVGAILGFLGACVLAWRGLIAWSINHSVKRAALASVRGSEKTSTWGGSGTGTTRSYYAPKGGFYSDYAAGSSMSLDALSSAGKQLHKPQHRDSETHSRHSSAMPPAGLFFSPTAQAASRSSLAVDNINRSSTFLPAGYYASPSAAQPAGGAGSTTVGGSLAPYARQSMVTPSPPGSSHGPGTARSAGSYAPRISRDGLRPHDDRRASSRDRVQSTSNRPASYAVNGMYNHPSSSSLMVGVGAQRSSANLGGTRAPSAYLDNLFENHGNGPRERY